ncbi:hypothetical protein ABB37_05666 [Leptomonas pyrrhocoris]|uniref:Uncharacterized protein n=1 Tax=Leptomonas pyrrhocoris TaxID=157538 RepID=A0A0M9FZH6_LEPPY|nr:hypothetical protein ABB37_05666 [Leptomonas pyrrhocoris]KPA79163.1 hypothetical protein ABB37_05666 [Leptomonas pyrrhocoris]|eukprot:XP_015657602.1 hypothetical protein ABB37_05666 [Leptomonas pyrrhocoris]
MASADSPTSMQLLIAHQYMHGPGAPPNISGSSDRRPRRLCSADLSSHGRSGGEYSPYLYSSVNEVTHQLPPTLGTHYGEAPYYRGNNEFDRQLRREVSLAAHDRSRPPQSAPPTHPSSARFAASARAPTSQNKTASRISFTSANGPSKKDAVRTGSAPPPSRSALSPSVTWRRPSQESLPSLSSASNAHAIVPEAALVPCLRLTVKQNGFVVRDELGTDKHMRFHRYLINTVS